MIMPGFFDLFSPMPPVLTTPRLTLRPVSRRDADDLFDSTKGIYVKGDVFEKALQEYLAAGKTIVPISIKCSIANLSPFNPCAFILINPIHPKNAQPRVISMVIQKYFLFNVLPISACI